MASILRRSMPDQPQNVLLLAGSFQDWMETVLRWAFTVWLWPQNWTQLIRVKTRGIPPWHQLMRSHDIHPFSVATLSTKLCCGPTISSIDIDVLLAMVSVDSRSRLQSIMWVAHLVLTLSLASWSAQWWSVQSWSPNIAISILVTRSSSLAIRFSIVASKRGTFNMYRVRIDLWARSCMRTEHFVVLQSQ